MISKSPDIVVFSIGGRESDTKISEDIGLSLSLNVSIE